MTGNGKVCIKGMFAVLKPLYAKYTNVGVFDVLDGPIKIISASSRSSIICPSSCFNEYSIASTLSK